MLQLCLRETDFSTFHLFCASLACSISVFPPNCPAIRMLITREALHHRTSITGGNHRAQRQRESKEPSLLIQRKWLKLSRLKSLVLHNSQDISSFSVSFYVNPRIVKKQGIHHFPQKQVRFHILCPSEQHKYIINSKDLYTQLLSNIKHIFLASVSCKYLQTGKD